jgi:hypothetical protein
MGLIFIGFSHLFLRWSPTLIFGFDDILSDSCTHNFKKLYHTTDITRYMLCLMCHLVKISNSALIDALHMALAAFFCFLSCHIIAWQKHMEFALENLHIRSRQNIVMKVWPSDNMSGVNFVEGIVGFGF